LNFIYTYTQKYKMTKQFLLLVTLTVISLFCDANTYFIASDGNDSNKGSIDDPWLSFEPAMRLIKSGDTLFLRQGIYFLDEQVVWEPSGNKDSWITISGYPKERVILDASNIPDLGQHVTGAFHLTGASYVKIENIELENSVGMGFSVFAPSSNVTIQDCKARRTFGPAIGCWNSSEIKVIGCEVSEANLRIMNKEGWQKREAPHEAISIAGVKGFEVAYNHVHHSEKEGIDVKEISAHGKVHHNVIHDIQRQGLYADAWFGLLEDVEFSYNTVFNCQWGAVICVEGKDSELKDVLLHHNLFYNNDGSGIYIGKWGHDGPRSGIKIYNNTLVDNGSASHWSGNTGNIDVRSSNLKDLEIHNNLLVSGGAYQIATFIDPKNESRFEKQEITIHHNFVGSWTENINQENKGYGWAYPVKGSDLKIGDPGFANPAYGDYSLGENSSALKNTLDGLPYGAIGDGKDFQRFKWPYSNE